ncbi:MAG: transketolase [Bernardetiaceae bacterium]|nr:transketolase [Bernardetiaceae bacterium]
MQTQSTIAEIKDGQFIREDVLNDYRIACESREASLAGRKEVFMGKAKFGIFGDGKEVPQLAMAKAFQKGDFRSGYYRDQTFMFAIGELTLQQYFAQLYAHTDLDHDPASAGRQMNGHFATPYVDERGEWLNLSERYNSSADGSPTASQMARLVGLAFASKLYRKNPELGEQATNFTKNGNEIAFGTIGDASTSEGVFFEAINAAGVLGVPMLMSVWDDGYGISVPKRYQTTKENISEILKGFQRNSSEEPGYEIFKAKGWDYEELCDTYLKAAYICRSEHVPVLLHVEEVTQPQGHSTSGSHERYKTEDRLAWEAEHDCIKKMREWIITNSLATAEELDEMEKQAKVAVREAKTAAWQAFMDSIKAEQEDALHILSEAANSASADTKTALEEIHNELKNTYNPIRKDAVRAMKKAMRVLRFEDSPIRARMRNWLERSAIANYDRFNSHLYSETPYSALKVQPVAAEYSDEPKVMDGREILQACFEKAFERYPEVVAFGEDVGKIGDVNQAFAGLQEKFGEVRIMDTGIREATIVGQGIGLAMRGFRPIAEIQYLDYLLYGLQVLSDDLASLRYRTKGQQRAPMIVRTRGHRLEGIWHSGSPISTILGSFRGIYVLVPRNMTQAAGFYNTMLKSDDPALIIECLNGYRLKEALPENIGEFCLPLGQPEVLREGSDITIVTYGSMCRIVMDAAEELEAYDISVEVIDVQTLLPFDLDHSILASIKKTNRVVFADEDVSGGASAYMMQKVIDEQGAYKFLDSKPVCVSAQDHRPAYASDGDYFSKPNQETVFDAAYALMHEFNPAHYPKID